MHCWRGFQACRWKYSFWKWEPFWACWSWYHLSTLLFLSYRFNLQLFFLFSRYCTSMQTVSFHGQEMGKLVTWIKQITCTSSQGRCFLGNGVIEICFLFIIVLLNLFDIVCLSRIGLGSLLSGAHIISDGMLQAASEWYGSWIKFTVLSFLNLLKVGLKMMPANIIYNFFAFVQSCFLYDRWTNSDGQIVSIYRSVTLSADTVHFDFQVSKFATIGVKWMLQF